MLPENWFWKEVGCRKHSSTLVGQMKANVKLDTKRKVQKITGSTIVQNGTRSDERSQRLSESGSKKTRTSKKEWKWQRGIVAHPLNMRDVCSKDIKKMLIKQARIERMYLD